MMNKIADYKEIFSVLFALLELCFTDFGFVLFDYLFDSRYLLISSFFANFIVSSVIVA